LMRFEWSLLGFLASLVGLSLVRRAFDGGKTENVLSLCGLVPTLFFLAQCLANLHAAGFAVSALAPVVTGVALYSLFCGNDFSYIGMFVLTATWSTLLIAGARFVGLYNSTQAWTGVLFAYSYLLYFAYDLSMLVKRRRVTEVPAAVADTYRDLLNFTT